MAILEVKNIEKHFGSTKVLKDISFDLEKDRHWLLSVLPVQERQLCLDV